MSVDPIQRIRALSLACPESSEKEAQVEDNLHNSGRLALWCKAKPGML